MAAPLLEVEGAPSTFLLRQRSLSEGSISTVFDTPGLHGVAVDPSLPGQPARLSYFGQLGRTIHGLTLRAALGCTLLLQASNVLALHFLGHGQGVHALQGHVGGLATTAVLQAAQLALSMVGGYLVWTASWRITMATACALYCIVLLTFAGLYLLCTLSDSDALAFAPELLRDSDDGESLWRGYVMLLYFSVEVQTLTGLGEVWASAVAAQLVCITQQLAGVLFNTWILSQTFHRFERRMTKGPRHGCLHVVSQLRVLKVIRKWTRQYLLPIVAVLQLATFTTLIVYGRHVDLRQESLAETWVVSVGMVLTVLQILVIAVTSSKFVIRKTHRLTMGFVAQSYFAIIITFSGFYALLFLSSTKRRAFWVPLDAWDEAPAGAHASRAGVPVLPLLVELLMFSISTLTSTGFGTIVPLTATARAAVAVQMLLQVTFTVLILGYGLSHIGQRRVGGTRRVNAPPPRAPPGYGTAPPLPVVEAPSGGEEAASSASDAKALPRQHSRRLLRSLHKAGHLDDGRRYYHTSSSSTGTDEEAIVRAASLHVPLLTPGAASPHAPVPSEGGAPTPPFFSLPAPAGGFAQRGAAERHASTSGISLPASQPLRGGVFRPHIVGPAEAHQSSAAALLRGFPAVSPGTGATQPSAASLTDASAESDV